jgi:hypothetical protein
MPNPSPQDRSQFEGSFSYHVGVLLSMSRLYLADGATLAADTAGRRPMYPAADALFEMLLLRLRSFDSFLACIGGNPTDATARDWVSSWAPRSVLLGTERADINKRLAHLTYEQPPFHDWAIGEMVRRCCEALEQFLTDLGAAGPSAWGTRLAELRTYLADHAAEGWDNVHTKNDGHAYRAI